MCNGPASPGSAPGTFVHLLRATSLRFLLGGPSRALGFVCVCLCCGILREQHFNAGDLTHEPEATVTWQGGDHSVSVTFVLFLIKKKSTTDPQPPLPGWGRGTALRGAPEAHATGGPGLPAGLDSGVSGVRHRAGSEEQRRSLLSAPTPPCTAATSSGRTPNPSEGTQPSRPPPASAGFELPGPRSHRAAAQPLQRFAL